MLTGWLHDAVAGLLPLQYAIAAVLATLVLLVLVYFCFRQLRWLRIVEDTPTALIRSAAQGFVELEGRAAFPRQPALTSPLCSRPCVWWSYRIEEIDVDGDFVEAGWWGFVIVAAWFLLHLFEVRRTGRLVESGESAQPFLIRDFSGACLVEPEHAEVIGAKTKVWTIGSRRFEESIIPVGARLYALGFFHTPSHDPAALEKREVGELISTWKLDRIKLAERFDANRDGQIDQVEWEVAWQAATDEVRRRRVEREPMPELHVLCNPRDARPFVLSLLHQDKLISRYWFQSVLSLLASATVVTVLAWSLRIRGLL